MEFIENPTWANLEVIEGFRPELAKSTNQKHNSIYSQLNVAKDNFLKAQSLTAEEPEINMTDESTIATATHESKLKNNVDTALESGNASHISFAQSELKNIKMVCLLH